MKIGLAAYAFKNGDLDFNLSQIQRAMARAGGKADLLCFGESFLQGFDALTWQYEHDRDVAISRDSSVMDRLKALTLRYGVDLLFGYVERDGESLYSSCAVLERGSLICNYRRISTGWRETDRTDAHYREGASPTPFRYKDRTLSVALCGDLWVYPERFSTDGLLIWPIYVNYDLDEWAASETDYARQARMAAGEVLMVNSLSAEPLSHGGAFHFRGGTVVEKLPFDREGILIAEI